MFIANAKYSKMEQIAADGTVYTPFLLLLRKRDFTFIKYLLQTAANGSICGPLISNVTNSVCLLPGYIHFIYG